MWPFKRNKDKQPTQPAGTVCPFCGGSDTHTLSVDPSQDQGHIKTWRGERFANFKCSACGREFYSDEPSQNEPGPDDRMIEDEDQLRAAEEELKKRTDAGDDRRFWPSE